MKQLGAILLCLLLHTYTFVISHNAGADVNATETFKKDIKLPTVDLPKPMNIEWLKEINIDDISYRSVRSGRSTLMELVLQESVREGLDAMSELYGKIQPNMLKNGQLLQDNHPAAFLARFNALNADSNAERREMAAYATLTATKAFRKNYKHVNDLARQSHTQKISLRRTALEGLCPPRNPPICMPASERYRTHDGTCNNKRRPRWGAAQMPFNRFLPPEYSDGVESIRSATDGNPLSSSRFVSLLVHGARDGDAPLTLMIAQWGQLLDHDITSTAQPRSINGSIPSCCGGKDFHPSCFPIKVPLDDPWLSPLKVRCLEFLRSAPAQRRDCALSWREQTNQATSYIDASPIYSNNAKISDNARIFRNGLLVYGRGNPIDDVCQRGAIASQCIRPGDGRSGEQPGLLAMHHVWVGEHNRIAMSLSELNSHWSDEKIYQETRRIIGAMFQHITYREFLPIILGREVCKLFDLQLLNFGYYEGYDSKVNPTVANAFAAAAFRFGHSLVQNSYIRCDQHHNIINNNVSLHEEFQRGDIGSEGSLHRLLRGLATQRALKRDEFITPELTNHLFQTPGFPFGLDLAAINIQRGRDHGIAPYTSWRLPCGLSPIQNWDDFTKVVGPESAKRIGHAYRSVHDIDLFVGGISERPVIGGLVGPTFACIIAQQFSNSRKGDRFWYENGGFENSFTPAQLHSIRRVSLAQVMCRAVGGGTFQPHIFIPADFPDNHRINCGVGLLAPIDLNPWIEQDPFIKQSPPPVTFQSQSLLHIPDKVINIVTPQLNVENLNSVLSVKEDRVEFSNRVKPPVSALKPQTDFIPNSSIGIQNPIDITQINDKLDIKRKQQKPNRRNTTRKPIDGINNKLDKSPKITPNINNSNTKRRTHTTTRRTVIIHNIPIELRNAAIVNINNKSTEELRPKEDIQSINQLKINSNTNQTQTANDAEKFMDKLDATKWTKASDHKLVQRNLKNSAEDKSLATNKTLAKKSEVKSLLHGLKNRTITVLATKLPKLFKTTKQPLAIRNRPINTQPQKVVLNGPNADQYEIEINIRQTHQNSATRPISDYTTMYQPYGPYESSYAPQHSDSTTSTPIYNYYQSPSTSNIRQTKPPTIIYLNDNDDYRTTRYPNIVQNFLTFATNGFNNKQKPTTQPTSIRGQRPSYETVEINSPYIGHSTSSDTRPPIQQSYYPISTYSQIGVNTATGYLHASSSALSSGDFGSISDATNTNGADSIFSFNIRPKPIHEEGSYGFLSSHPTSYMPEYIYMPTVTPQTELYYDRELTQSGSPFSFAMQKPHSKNIYGRKTELKKRYDYDNNITTSADHKLDYDYLSRTLRPPTNSNKTEDLESVETAEKDNTDYQYIDDQSSKEQIISLYQKFDMDDYLRPKQMIESLDKCKTLTEENKTVTNGTYLNDNYVLPLLQNMTITKTLVTINLDAMANLITNTTNPTDVLPKHLSNDIIAQQSEENAFITSALRRRNTSIAFAPIKILTEPNRPNNWVIYETPNQEQPLPAMPIIAMDSQPSSEVPTPIKDTNNLWMKKKFNGTKTEYTLLENTEEKEKET